MKPIRYIIGILTAGYHIILGLTLMLTMMFLGYFCIIALIYAILPAFIIGQILEAIFDRNIIEEGFSIIEKTIEKYNPIDKIIEILYENKMVEYGGKCIDELKDDWESFISRISSKPTKHKDAENTTYSEARSSKHYFTKKIGHVGNQNPSLKTLELLNQSLKEIRN